MINENKQHKDTKKRTRRTNGVDGVELKKNCTMKAYPSKIKKLKLAGLTLQKALDAGIELLLK